MTGLLYGATLAAALGCGVVAGVFFTFSAFVMRALDGLPAAAGIAAMQSINRAAVGPPVMAVLFGTTALCAGLAIWAVAEWGERPAAWVLAGSALFLIGAVGVTGAANVPRNDALATVDPRSPEAASRWSGYIVSWTAWNHVRGAAALGATALLIVALATTERDVVDRGGGAAATVSAPLAAIRCPVNDRHKHRPRAKATTGIDRCTRLCSRPLRALLVSAACFDPC